MMNEVLLMGLFNLFKPKKGNNDQEVSVAVTSEDERNDQYAIADSSSISPDERPYYRPDEYYTYFSYPGTDMARRVITFEDRKKISCPSSRGLYVAEILLLEYCNYGKYPKPKNGYPGFWWFEYGIRDVGHKLESLEQRGFLQWRSIKNSLSNFKVVQLKEVLQNAGLPSTGKKAELIDRICTEIPEENIPVTSENRKYELTALGKSELSQNGYVLYMHKHPYKTTEDTRFGDEFNVWSVNKLFQNGDASNWRQIVGQIELQKFGVNMAENQKSVSKVKTRKKQDYPAERDAMREFLKENEKKIERGIRSSGDGFKEEEKGLSYKYIGKDKEALIQFYISIGKKFDAPALYNETAALLGKYGLYEEELQVIDQGLEVVSENNPHRNELIKRREKVCRLMRK